MRIAFDSIYNAQRITVKANREAEEIRVTKVICKGKSIPLAEIPLPVLRRLDREAKEYGAPDGDEE